MILVLSQESELLPRFHWLLFLLITGSNWCLQLISVLTCFVDYNSDIYIRFEFVRFLVVICPSLLLWCYIRKVKGKVDS